jgi:error-prone DNA polymerase
MTGCAELAVSSNFSFLRGASHPEELVAQAFAIGLSGLGLADRNTLAGVVRAHQAWQDTGARAAGFKLAAGSRLVFADGTPDILVYPATRGGWARLCRLLTAGNRKSPKGQCLLVRDDLLNDLGGLLCIVMPSLRPDSNFADFLRTMAPLSAKSVWLAADMPYAGSDRRRLAHLDTLARSAGVPLLASNAPLMHHPDRRQLADVVACIREHTTVEAAGRLLAANAERHLKPPGEMARLFRDAPGAVSETLRFLERVTFTLDEIRYDYPDEPVPPGATAQSHLEALTWQFAAQRYGDGIPTKIRDVLNKELALIARLDYAPYFLTVYDIVRFARENNILCQGRGSAANSAICFMLGITAVDPSEIDLLFERFVSEERREPPDIDVDFEHERREEVIQYIYARYGRARAGIAATVISYRPKSAIREVGKALGLSEDITAALAKTVWGSWGDGLSDSQIVEAGLDPRNPMIRRTADLARELCGFPRHLSQHVGGFVLTRGRLDETVPIGNAAMPDRTFIEWDKDDLDTLGLLKIDVLALGMLTCIRKAFDLLSHHDGLQFDLANVPREDPAVYAMLQAGDSIGVFQVESRAQMNMLPRLKPATFYDLVIEVAIVRPGPIQGDMVHPYLRRRNGLDPVEFPSPSPEHGPPDELARVLGKTKGVPLFQEQAMRIAIEAAKFTPSEANQLRRAMATFRKVGTIHTFHEKMVEGMVQRGYDRDFAERSFKQIEGFGSYGFPESHAASFARLVYVSSWLKCHHPAAFACALLNSQPMGFYAPAQIVRDATDHGVAARSVEVNASCWDSTLERGEDGRLALRLGLRKIDGFREDWARAIERARADGPPFADVEGFARRTGLSRPALLKLADADCFRSIGLDRRLALWAVRRLPDDSPLPLFSAAAARELGCEPDARLPAMALAEHVVADYQTLMLSLKAHPMSFLRDRLRGEGIKTCAEATAVANGGWVRAAGLVLVRQRPGSAKGVIFMTIEDETGVANAVVWPKVTEKYRRQLMAASLILIEGRIQRSPEGVVHLVAVRLVDRTADLATLSDSHSHRHELSRADEIMHPQHPRTSNHPRNVRVIPKSRDFH